MSESSIPPPPPTANPAPPPAPPQSSEISSGSPSEQTASHAPSSLGLLSNYMTFNFGGPGWISDIFEVSVNFDGCSNVLDLGSKYTIPWTSYKGYAPCYNSESIVTGTVTVKAPEPHKVLAGGISVRIDEYVCLLDPFVTNDINHVEGILVEGDVWIEGEQTYKFEIDLSTLSASPLQSDYVGTLFAVKHAFVVEIARPWWTFNVIHYEPLSVYNAQELPTGNLGRRQMSEEEIEMAIETELRANELTGEDDEEDSVVRDRWLESYNREMNTPSNLLSVLDFPAKVCEFEYGHDWCETGGVISGALNVQEAQVGVKSMTLTLFKVESVDGEQVESVLKTIDLCPKSDTDESGVAEAFVPVFNGARIDFDTGRIHTQTTKDSDDESLWLAPTISKAPSGTSDNAEKHNFSCAYFLRLNLVSDLDVNYWDSNEVYFYRARMPEGVSAGQGDEGAGGLSV
ncbi:hypothetical protein TrST_g10619 [Triparma strigata]|uniref:Uncharacterized protein n=1 Tax=Triparma strigata TaxID=1606541 RepID=A0A9W7AUF1_9STRA|nr:hypothetical protein TrST_g10619 [Triparma strigata]